MGPTLYLEEMTTRLRYKVFGVPDTYLTLHLNFTLPFFLASGSVVTIHNKVI